MTRRRNLRIRQAYADCFDVAGPLTPATRTDQPVEFRSVVSRKERLVLALLVLLNAGTAVAFIGWLLLPWHVPGWSGGLSRPALIASLVGFCLVIAVEVIRLAQNAAMWVFAAHAKDPVPVEPPVGLRVALLTTIVPSSEPVEVVERTLRKMLQIAYLGQVDVWILDEGDDPRVKALARQLGVRHFSRLGRPEYNQPAGEFRARTKSGNHNAWRAEHEHEYDVVAQMDPDHVPLPCFLQRTLGYFRDPDVAFVVAPQVYGNIFENWITHGASVQQYIFSGVVERGGNGLQAPLLIGTNHLYRPAAWQQIGGYQDSIIEDHLTSMRVQSTINPATGNRWRGVYTPDVLAVGEGPSSWQDYFSQQKRWSYGIWEILLRRLGSVRRGLTWRQRLLYGCVQFYYPSVAAGLLLGNAATALYLLFGISSIQLHSLTWLALWTASLASWLLLWFWLRRFNIAEHERQEFGMPGMAFALFAGPVYVAAAVAALLRRPLSYAVTAKGRLRGGVSLRTFRLHLCWAAAAAALLAVSFLRGHDYLVLRVWCGLTMLVGLTPPLLAALSHWIGRGRRLTAPAPVRATAWVRAVGRAPLNPVAIGVAQAPDSSSPGRHPGRRHARSSVDETTTTGLSAPAQARGKTPARGKTQAGGKTQARGKTPARGKTRRGSAPRATGSRHGDHKEERS